MSDLPKILFFDDREERYQELIKNVPAGWVYWARTPEEAISILEEYSEDLVLWLLDHDMDQAPDTQLDGRDLILWVLLNSQVLENDPKIVIHSLNEEASLAMYHMLKGFCPQLNVELAMYAWLAIRSENNCIKLGENLIFI